MARDRRHRAGRPLRLPARRRSHGAARPALSAPARRGARPLAVVGSAADAAWTDCHVARPVGRRCGDLRAARGHLHRRRHVRLRHRKAGLPGRSRGRLRRADAGQLLCRHAWLGIRRRAVVQRARTLRRSGRPGALRRRLPRTRFGCADRRGVQPPRPVGQLPAAVRPLPVVGEQPVGRGHQRRRRRLGRGAPLHHRVRAALDARLPRRRPATGRGTRAGGHHRDPHPRGARDRNRLAVKAGGPPAVAGRRKRPQRPAADHPARSRRLRADRAVGRRHPSRHPHRGVRRAPGLLRRLRHRWPRWRRRCATASFTPPPIRRSAGAAMGGRWTPREPSRRPGCSPTPARTTRSATAPSATARRRT